MSIPSLVFPAAPSSAAAPKSPKERHASDESLAIQYLRQLKTFLDSPDRWISRIDGEPLSLTEIIEFRELCRNIDDLLKQNKTIDL